LKSAVDKQRAEVPALVMKQTTSHLEQLQSFDGALQEIEEMRRDTENLARTHGATAVDVQKDLLQKCEQLPELQRRLQTATAKLGTILSQMDAAAPPKGVRV
jgi:chaperonin cofactor prefoldin|tara:strand:- start:19582 stop:19887 length:306 start_codon:yes stop_codon:yes gene_type:complete